MTSIETNSYIHISNGISNKIRTKELKKFIKRYDEGKIESVFQGPSIFFNWILNAYIYERAFDILKLFSNAYIVTLHKIE